MPIGIYKRTEEAKRNMSLARKNNPKIFIPNNGIKFKKGESPWNKGRQENRKDVIERLSISHIGQIGWSKGTKGVLKANSGSFKKGRIVKRGNGNPNWKGGTTPINKAIRKSTKYIEWRTFIFIRDNRKCVLCNSKKEVQVDHYPIPFSAILNKLIVEQGLENLLEKAISYELFWITDNGRTLCFDCHKKTDSYGGKAPRININ